MAANKKKKHFQKHQRQPEESAAGQTHNLRVRIKQSASKKTAAARTPAPAAEKPEKERFSPEKNLVPASERSQSKDRTAGPGTRRTNIFPQNEEHDKNLILWSGVVFFMLLIVAFWAYSTGKQFRKIDSSKTDNFTLDDWRTAADDVGEKMKQLKQDLEAIKESGTNAGETNFPASETAGSSTAAAAPVASTTEADKEAIKGEILEMQDRLGDLEDKLKEQKTDN